MLGRTLTCVFVYACKGLPTDLPKWVEGVINELALDGEHVFRKYTILLILEIPVNREVIEK